MNTQRCATCNHYRMIEKNVGQCYFLAVKVVKGVAIIDRKEILEAIKMERKEKNYNGTVVQSTFGCIGHNIKVRLENQNNP